MRRWGLILAVVLLAACRSPQEETTLQLNRITYVEVATPSGSIPCIVYDGNTEAGLSCDWGGR
jgi:uncharacterized lipoprotein YmbA